MFGAELSKDKIVKCININLLKYKLNKTHEGISEGLGITLGISSECQNAVERCAEFATNLYYNISIAQVGFAVWKTSSIGLRLVFDSISGSTEARIQQNQDLRR